MASADPPPEDAAAKPVRAPARERRSPGQARPAATSPWAPLWSGRMLLYCWLPIVLIGVLHYGTEPEHAWLHNSKREALVSTT